MKRIRYEDYLDFLRENESVIIGRTKIRSNKEQKISVLAPSDFHLETETVWSFPDRGEWATHKGDFRGNWSPYIPRNLILRYTVPRETVLDQMCGSGTTLIESKLLGRNAIGVDINPQAIMLSHNRLDFSNKEADTESQIELYVGDARNLHLIKNESVDLIATHPPYAGIIKYSNKLEGDLSCLKIPAYIKAMKKVAEESFRVLKQGHICAVLVGDTRKHLHYIPISTMVLNQFIETGFLLREDIIKLQWKTKTSYEKWRGKQRFYKIAHEHIFVFRKPLHDEKLSKYKYSRTLTI